MASITEASRRARGTSRSSTPRGAGATLLSLTTLLPPTTLVGCGSMLPRIPVASPMRRVVSIDARGGILCLFESGDVWCGGPAFEPHFVDRHRGLAYQSIVVGENFGCGIDSERYVDCWGLISQQRGASVLESVLQVEGAPRGPEKGPRASRSPFRVRGLADVKEIRGSFGRLCALEGAEVWCMSLSGPRNGYAYDDGDEYGFGLGDPGCTEGGICGVDAPLHDDRAGGGFVLGYPRMLQVTSARALASVGMFTCAIDADQRVTCWGTESEGLMLRSLREAKPELELEGEERTRGPEAEALELAGATAIELGQSHACALSSSSGPHADPRAIVAETNKGEERGGQLWCWGENESGQLGNAVNVHSSLPARVQGLDDVEAFAMTGSSTCAIADGELWCWGQLAGLPVLEDPDKDPCLNRRAVCVPHRVLEFKTKER